MAIFDVFAGHDMVDHDSIGEDSLDEEIDIS